jgi:glycosyltransferase involved in cell wall biosynthesis
MRVLITSENASMRMSGETLLPLYYFRKMRERGVEVHMVTHARCRDELQETLDPDDYARVHFIEDSSSQKALWQLFSGVPERIRALLLDQAIHLSTQLRARTLVKQLVARHGIDMVFEPAPISPKGISCMYDVGAPVVVGPLCGGMNFPPAFKYMDGLSTRVGVSLGRIASPLFHRVLRGKLDAAAVLVGNQRTARVLPEGIQGAVHEVVESGVDLDLWQPFERPPAQPGQPLRYVFMARFVDWKGIEFLVEAFAQVVRRAAERHVPVKLELIGDGELFEATKAQVARLGIDASVHFYGRVPLQRAEEIIRSCDVYMAPALRECGGCALLECMAIAMPIISCNWAGPAEYLGGGCGLLVDPTSREDFVNGLADAMVQLAESPELRRKLGAAASHRVRNGLYDWDSKTDRVLEIFSQILGRPHDVGRRKQVAQQPHYS